MVFYPNKNYSKMDQFTCRFVILNTQIRPSIGFISVYIGMRACGQINGLRESVFVKILIIITHEPGLPFDTFYRDQKKSGNWIARHLTGNGMTSPAPSHSIVSFCSLLIAKNRRLVHNSILSRLPCNKRIDIKLWFDVRNNWRSRNKSEEANGG